MTRLRRLLFPGQSTDADRHERIVNYVRSEWDEILSTLAAAGIQVEAEFMHDDDEPDADHKPS